MKRSSTHFLRAVVFLMGSAALFLCFLILPTIAEEWGPAYPEFEYLKYPFMISLGATTIPFFIALYQTLKLLSYVDNNTAFSELSVKSLKYIKYCAFIFGTLYAASMPFFYLVGDKTDAPGVIVIGMIMTFAPIVIAVFAAVLQKLLQSAIDIKSENDLTV
jgi:DUF2975 family protein